MEVDVEAVLIRGVTPNVAQRALYFDRIFVMSSGEISIFDVPERWDGFCCG